MIGIAADLMIRVEVEQRIFENTERAAVDWIGAMNQARPPPPVTTSDVSLIQLINSSGQVVSANRAAAGLPRLSEYWPPSDDRIEHRTECTAAQCVMLTAVRPSPQEEQLLWGGESHIVYAGRRQPTILATHALELVLGGGALIGSLIFAGATWILVRQALRPVEAIRRRIAQVTVTDLSLRVPQPPGRDAIARLARTANETLSRLQEAVDHQRHFASMVSHELRTPLTGLRTQLEEALLYSDVDPRVAVEDSLSTLERCQSIIDEMLALTRVRTSPHKHEQVDLTALVRQEVARRDTRVPVRIHAEEDVEVYGNPVQLTEVLMNLLLNAQRHARTCVEVRVARLGGQAMVSVVDDGAGIPPADREQVFAPFVRLAEGRRRDPQGSGLGLAISQAIAQVHQGTLTIEDSPQGAKFVLSLPLAPG
ncbi:sensor histidine kinase [Nonomuraea sp. NPDC049400]|uniref:sensor histidine kinase n=1 Tax=Nonomuraea sp. NPDC049400 TaxID=3364352 RepID=UPI0037A87B6A